MRLLQSLLIVVVVPPRSLSSSVLLLFKALVAIVAAATAATAAEARAVLFVPGAQGLATKHEIIVLDDDGLDPCLGVEVNLVGGGVHGL